MDAFPYHKNSFQASLPAISTGLDLEKPVET